MPFRVQLELDTGEQRGARHAILKDLSAWWETAVQKGGGPASGPGLEQTMGVERRGPGVFEEFGQHPLEAGAVTSVMIVPPLI